MNNDRWIVKNVFPFEIVSYPANKYRIWGETFDNKIEAQAKQLEFLIEYCKNNNDPTKVVLYVKRLLEIKMNNAELFI